MTQIYKLFALLPIAAALTACGGGSGGGSASMPVKQFTSMSGLDSNAQYQMDGKSVEIDYTANLSTGFVTSISEFKKGDSTATVMQTDEGYFQSLTIETPYSSGSLSGVENASNLSGGVVRVINDGGQEIGIYVNPLISGWNYQTYGAWMTGYNTGAGVAGAGTFGAVTPTVSVPDKGMATYQGRSSGYSLSSVGFPYLTDASFVAQVDFEKRLIDVATYGTSRYTTNTGIQIPTPSLDYQGTLSYNPGNNNFSGPVVSDGMMGSATGQFYGPLAQEIGGTYQLAGSAGRQAGAFGASQ